MFMAKKKTTNQFIDEAKNVHGNKYDYSKVIYVNDRTKVCIICPEHGEFFQIPSNHLKGKGCMKCSMKNKPQCLPVGKDVFVEKARKVHGNKYDYSKVSYVDGLTKVTIICPKHGEYEQKPQNHLAGCGCQKCQDEKRGISQKWDIKKFVSEAKNVHGEKYDYSLVEYRNTDTPVNIICPIHGIFSQTPYHHVRRKQGCPACNSSSLETLVRVILEKNGIKFQEQKKFPWLKGKSGWPLTYDFYLQEKNIAIECQGLQHFEPSDFFFFFKNFQDTVERDEIKKKLSKENGVKILYYSNLNIDFPYDVITDEDTLLSEIKTKYRAKGTDLFLI